MVNVKRSVQPYFGNYLQTSTQSLFWLMYFFSFGIHKDSEMITVVLFMFLCLLCKPPKLEPRSCEYFHTLLVELQITRIWSWLMITHSRKSTLCVASYRLDTVDSLYVHTRWRILELRFIIGAKTYDPINITSTFGNDNSVQQGKHLSFSDLMWWNLPTGS